MNIEEKLKILNSRKLPEDSQAIIQGWQDDLVSLKIESEWLENPNTERLKALVIDQVNEANHSLTNDANISQENRWIIMKHKDMLMILLAVLTRNPEEDLKSLESKINFEIQ